MKKNDIFRTVLDVVSEHTEVSQERIISNGRRKEEVDARCMAIHYWKLYGLETTYLMQQMNRKHHNSIQHLYNMFVDRQQSCRYFRIQSNQIGQILANMLTIG